jgi:hypothetical protein
MRDTPIYLLKLNSPRPHTPREAARYHLMISSSHLCREMS